MVTRSLQSLSLDFYILGSFKIQETGPAHLPRITEWKSRGADPNRVLSLLSGTASFNIHRPLLLPICLVFIHIWKMGIIAIGPT